MNNLKHSQKLNKMNTSTKLLSAEYAIINKQGEVTATTNKDLVNQALTDENKKVFLVKTYSVTTKTLINHEQLSSTN